MSREPSSVPAVAQSPQRLRPVWIALIAAAAAGWVWLALRASDMGVGPGTMGMALPAFVGMWVVMMGAMMFPAIAPMVSRSAGTRAAPAGAFAVGFLVPWALYGLVAYVGLRGVERLVASSPDGARWLGVGLFVLAGAWQLTPWKRASILHCRLVGHGHGAVRGTAGGFAAGVRDGAWCVGCCWALMTLMAAVGVMNVGAMVAIAAIIFVEKIFPRPERTAAWFGVGLLAFGAAAAFLPDLLPGLSGAVHDMYVPGIGDPAMPGMDADTSHGM